MKGFFVFLGKGGVGKTTLSCSLAVYLAERGNSVYLASIDPAHNIFDFFGIKSRQGPVSVLPGLTVEEFDVDGYLKEFLRDTTKRMKQTYRHLQIINLENMFDVLKHSPGMEEFSLVSAVDELIGKWKDEVDYIVMDTPPTGLMIRIFSLPVTTIMWLEKLKDLRRKILERRSQILHIRPDAFGEEKVPFDEKDDPILSQLGRHEEMASRLVGLFRDSSLCKKILVINHDELSVKEGEKILRDLMDLSFEVNALALNKKGMRIDESIELPGEMATLPRVEIPFFPEDATPRDKMSHVGEKIFEMLS